jgi:hypothetical protein
MVSLSILSSKTLLLEVMLLRMFFWTFLNKMKKNIENKDV